MRCLSLHTTDSCLSSHVTLLFQSVVKNNYVFPGLITGAESHREAFGPAGKNHREPLVVLEQVAQHKVIFTKEGPEKWWGRGIRPRRSAGGIKTKEGWKRGWSGELNPSVISLHPVWVILCPHPPWMAPLSHTVCGIILTFRNVGVYLCSHRPSPLSWHCCYSLRLPLSASLLPSLAPESMGLVLSYPRASHSFALTLAASTGRPLSHAKQCPGHRSEPGPLP